MENKKNRILKFRSGLIVMGVLLFMGLSSCTSSNNESKQVPRLPAQLQNQVQENSVNTEAPAPASAEDTGQTQSEGNNVVMLNPPHGQPGHSCEIPVGAPLNTVAANSSTQTTTGGTAATAPTIRNNSMAPTIENANRIMPSQQQATAAPASGPKPANNPPHGQPWHRCDIAVGSPLP